MSYYAISDTHWERLNHILPTKLHVLTDALGNAVDILLNGGEVADITVALALIANVTNTEILADKGYDSQALIEQIEKQGCVPIIPSRRKNTQQRAIDKHKYKERHLVECYFNKINEFKKIATRYDKLTRVFMAFTLFASTLLWIK